MGYSISFFERADIYISQRIGKEEVGQNTSTQRNQGAGMNAKNMLQNIITDFRIALEKAKLAEDSSDCFMSYVILKSSVIAKIKDLELLGEKFE